MEKSATTIGSTGFGFLMRRLLLPLLVDFSGVNTMSVWFSLIFVCADLRDESHTESHMEEDAKVHSDTQAAVEGLLSNTLCLCFT